MKVLHILVLTALCAGVNLLHGPGDAGSRDGQFRLQSSQSSRNTVSNDSAPAVQPELEVHHETAAEFSSIDSNKNYLSRDPHGKDTVNVKAVTSSENGVSNNSPHSVELGDDAHNEMAVKTSWYDVSNTSPPQAEHGNDAHNLTMAAVHSPRLTENAHISRGTTLSEQPRDILNKTENPDKPDQKHNRRKAEANVKKQTSAKGTTELEGSPANLPRKPEDDEVNIGHGNRTVEELKTEEQGEQEEKWKAKEHSPHQQQLKERSEEKEQKWNGTQLTTEMGQNEEGDTNEKEKEEYSEEDIDTAPDTTPGQMVDPALSWNTSEATHDVLDGSTSWNFKETAGDGVQPYLSETISGEEGSQGDFLYAAEVQSQANGPLKLSSVLEENLLEVSNTSAHGGRLKRVRRQTSYALQADGPALVYREGYNVSAECRCRRCDPVCKAKHWPCEDSGPKVCKRWAYACNSTTEAVLFNQSENVAFNKPADQEGHYTVLYQTLIGCGVVNGYLSSQLHSRGDFNNIVLNCMHAASITQKPWFRVDLIYVYTIKHMFLYRRGGTAERYFGDTLGVYVDLNTCAIFSVSYLAQNMVMKLSCDQPQTGRFVMLATVGNKWLSFCELMIWVCRDGKYGPTDSQCNACPRECKYNCDNWYGCDKQLIYNVAIGKQASQSEAASRSKVNRVTDGFFILGKHCFTQETNGKKTYWVQVDLETHFKVFYFVIRPNNEHSEIHNPGDFNATVSNYTDEGVQFPPTPEVQCFYQEAEIRQRDDTTLNCTVPMVGRYFSLISRSSQGFKMCELGVYGHHRYALENGAGCYELSETAVCLPGSTCHIGKCKVGVSYSCASTEDCMSGSLCEHGICKTQLNQDCQQSQDYCSTGLKCSVAAGFKCKLDFNARCTSNEDCVSTDTVLCDPVLLLCKRKRGKHCAVNGDCTAGAVCRSWTCQCQSAYSTPLGDRCKPVSGRIGSQCGSGTPCTVDQGQCDNAKCVCPALYSIYGPDFSCKLKAGSQCSSDSDCNTGLQCQGGVCKIKVGSSCNANAAYCLSGLVCEENPNICKAQVGAACTNTHNFCVRQAVCSSGMCKLTLNKDCTQFRGMCVEGLICSDEIDGFKCKVTEGHNCMPHDAGEEEECRSGTHCDTEHSKCKIDVENPCNVTAQCQSGTVCSTKPDDTDKKCRFHAGSLGCRNDDQCRGNYVCDSQHQCMLAMGANCTLIPALCHAGSTCIGGTCQCNTSVTASVGQSDECSPLERVVGGSCQTTGANAGCRDSIATCSDNICQCPDQYSANPGDLTCGISASVSCALNASLSPCISRALCVAGTCLLKAGQPCAGSSSALCSIGTVCDNGVCRLGLHQTCSVEYPNCKTDTVCDGLLLKCKKRPSSFCRYDKLECMAASQCVNNSCQCNDDVSTLNNGVCVLNAGMVGAHCSNGSICHDPNATCNSQGTCQCQHALVPDARLLNCANEVGQTCEMDDDCSSGTVCDVEVQQCKIQVGSLCDGDNKNNCVSGTVCDVDSKCKLGLKGNCSGDHFGYCARNTYCDRLDQCQIGVGDSCKNRTDSCVAGAVCFRSVCACDGDFAIQYGPVCDPKPGRYGSDCSSSSECQTNSECEEGTCICEAGANPDRTFACKSSASRGADNTKFIGITIGALLAAVLMAAMFGIYRRQRDSEKREDMFKGMSESMKQVRELRISAAGLPQMGPGQVGSSAGHGAAITSVVTDHTSGISETAHGMGLLPTAELEPSSMSGSEFEPSSMSGSEFSQRPN